MGNSPPTPPKLQPGAECTQSHECVSNLCVKMCDLAGTKDRLRNWKKNPDIDAWNKKGYCNMKGLSPNKMGCFNPVTYKYEEVLLFANGVVYYGNKVPPGPKQFWNKNQCIDRYNCHQRVTETEALTMTDTTTSLDTETLAIEAFAIIGLLFVLLALYRFLTRLVTKKTETSAATVNHTFEETPTEWTTLERSPMAV